MYIKALRIVEGNGLEIRNVPFKNGLNIVVDESDDDKGNNVGKTTFLKLIDICLGADDKKYIWTDSDTGSETKDLKDYIHKNKVFVELTIVNKDSKYNLKVELHNKGKRYINGKPFNYQNYIEELNSIFFSIKKPPTFRQLIKKFVRIKQKEDYFATLKYLHTNTTNNEYRNIYEFLFKLDSLENSTKRLELEKNINHLENSRKELFKLHQFSSIEEVTERKKIVENRVKELQQSIDIIVDTGKYKRSLEEAAEVKNALNILNDSLNGALFKKSKIENILSKEKESSNDINIELLNSFYQEISHDFSSLSKSFQDLIDFNNQIKRNKIEYYTKRLVEINYDIQKMQQKQISLIDENREIINLINQDNFKEFEDKYNNLLSQNQKLGELLKVTKIYHNLTEKIDELSSELEELNTEKKGKDNITKFNNYFSRFSEKVFDQRLLVYPNEGFPLKLSNVDEGIGTGHKKTITLLLDIAYVSFISELNIDYPRFIVHDVLETIDEHNFRKIVDFIHSNGTQFVFGILNEKISNYSFITEQDKILKLSKDNKLFKV